jgi:hypothetical protein
MMYVNKGIRISSFPVNFVAGNYVVYRNKRIEEVVGQI